MPGNIQNHTSKRKQQIFIWYVIIIDTPSSSLNLNQKTKYLIQEKHNRTTLGS